MDNDMAYAYFKKATEQWLEKNEKTQNWLALEIDVGDGTISRYFGSTRNIPFDKQIKIANACGFDYLSFLQYGKKLLGGITLENNNIQNLDKITKEHQKIIFNFKDKEKGLEANKALILLEEIDRELFIDAVGEIRGYAKAAQNIKTRTNKKEDSNPAVSGDDQPC